MLVRIKQVLVFVVMMFIASWLMTGIVMALVSFMSETEIKSFFGLGKKELCEYVSELFYLAFIMTYLFKSKIKQKRQFVAVYVILCLLLFFIPMLLE